MFASASLDITARSSNGCRSAMSISSLPSRNWATVVPDRIVWAAFASAWLDTPSARALSWSSVSFSDFTCSFQLSFTPTVFGLARTTSLTWSAIERTVATSVPCTRNCTGYGTGGPLGSSLTRPRRFGKSLRNSSIIRTRRALRSRSERGVTMISARLVLLNC